MLDPKLLINTFLPWLNKSVLPIFTKDFDKFITCVKDGYINNEPNDSKTTRIITHIKDIIDKDIIAKIKDPKKKEDGNSKLEDVQKILEEVQKYIGKIENYLESLRIIIIKDTKDIIAKIQDNKDKKDGNYVEDLEEIQKYLESLDKNINSNNESNDSTTTRIITDIKDIIAKIKEKKGKKDLEEVQEYIGKIENYLECLRIIKDTKDIIAKIQDNKDKKDGNYVEDLEEIQKYLESLDKNINSNNESNDSTTTRIITDIKDIIAKIKYNKDKKDYNSKLEDVETSQKEIQEHIEKTEKYLESLDKDSSSKKLIGLFESDKEIKSLLDKYRKATEEFLESLKKSKKELEPFKKSILPEINTLEEECSSLKNKCDKLTEAYEQLVKHLEDNYLRYKYILETVLRFIIKRPLKATGVIIVIFAGSGFCIQNFSNILSSSRYTILSMKDKKTFSYSQNGAWSDINKEMVDNKSLDKLHLNPGTYDPRKANDKLITGEISFVQSISPPTIEEYNKAKKINVNLKIRPVGNYLIAIAVNQKLIGVTHLTIPQLRGIYTGKITNWNQLGGQNLDITPYKLNDDHPNTIFFKDSVLFGKDFSKTVMTFDTLTQALQKLKQDPSGVYFGSAPQIVNQCLINTLSVSYSEEAKAISPYQEDDKYNRECSRKTRKQSLKGIDDKYPLQRQIFVIYREEDNKNDNWFNWLFDYDNIGDFYANWLLSRDGQRMIKKANFIPIQEKNK